MGLEVLAPLDLRESFRKLILHERECYPRSGVATILLTGVDLFFRGKLEASLPAHHFITVDNVDPPDLVIADIARVDPDEVAETFPDTPILGYTNHADTAGLRRAHEAGFDQVVAKSALVERAPKLVEELIT
jgi:DNA-binding NarL/FixJ family response regulator